MEWHDRAGRIVRGRSELQVGSHRLSTPRCESRSREERQNRSMCRQVYDILCNMPGNRTIWHMRHGPVVYCAQNLDARCLLCPFHFYVLHVNVQSTPENMSRGRLVRPSTIVSNDALLSSRKHVQDATEEVSTVLFASFFCSIPALTTLERARLPSSGSAAQARPSRCWNTRFHTARICPCGSSTTCGTLLKIIVARLSRS